MSRPKQATTLEELAEKTGIEEELLVNYAFLSKGPSIDISYRSYNFPTLFFRRAIRYTDPSRFRFKDTPDTPRQQFIPRKITHINGLLPNFTELQIDTANYHRTIDEDTIFPLDEKVDRISIMFHDYFECNSKNPKEWYIFRSTQMIDDEHSSWAPDKDKWQRFCKLKPRQRAEILWLWFQYLNLSMVVKKTSRGPKFQRLKKMRIFLILSELEKIDIDYKHFWAANFLNIIYNIPLKEGFNQDVHDIRDYNPRLHDLKTRIKNKSGSMLEERAGESRLSSAWSVINAQIKPLEKIAPSKLSPSHVR